MTLATLNGQTVTACRVHLPAWGIWFAEAECASATVLSGAATLVVDDLTLKGTILSGGAYEARTRYRIAGGAGGWGRTIPAKSYANDLGVKTSTVLTDAARVCGEQLGTPPAGTVGLAYVRDEAPASRVLEAVAPRGWYVDESGVTQIGRRPRTTYTGGATRITDDHAQVILELAPPAISTLLPGVVVDGIEAVDVEHELAGGKLRTRVWGRGPAATSRLESALARIIEANTAHLRYCAPWEYRVVQRIGERLELQPSRVASGMPSLGNVRIRPGVGGGRVHPKLGSLVLVSFVNGDRGRPVVTSFDEQDGPGWIPDEIALQAGTTGASPTEHATSAEALVLFVYEALVAMGALIAPTPVTAVQVKGAIATALALFTGSPKPALGDADVVPLSGATKTALLAAIAAKSADTNGDTPSLGWPNVRGG